MSERTILSSFLLAIALLFMTFGNSKAQPGEPSEKIKPRGYLGKYFNFTYDFAFYPTNRHPNFNESSGMSSMNIRNSLGVFAVIGENHSFGFNYGMFNTLIPLEGNGYPAYEGGNLMNGTLDAGKGFVGIKAREYRFSLRIFQEASHAPIGFHTELGISYYRVTTQPTEGSSFSQEYEETYGRVTDLEDYDDRIFSFNYSMMSQRIIYDFISLRYGIEIKLPALSSNNGRFPILNSQHDKYLGTLVHRRVLAHEFFNLKVGIGLIPF